MTFRCNATVNAKRCDFRGSRTELVEHAAETGHYLCPSCQRSMRSGERRVCDKCMNALRNDIREILTAAERLDETIVHSGLRGSSLPGGDALVLACDGRVDGGGPDDWLSDPTPVVALLRAVADSWRDDLGHEMTDVDTADGHGAYLLRWLSSARNLDSIVDNIFELRTLRIKVTHVVGVANDPQVAFADCFDCGGVLERPYREPVADPRLLRKGLDCEGLPDDWECRACGGVYEPASFWLAVRARLERQAGVA